MDTIRFSILLSLLFFGGYANHTAEKNIKERQAKDMRLVELNELTDKNYSFIRRALDIHKSSSKENGGVLSASLIVKDGKVVGEGSDKSTHFTDPSAHATMTAVRAASNNIGMTSLKGCTLYSTAELCPMCVSLLHVADIDKIIYCIPSEEGPSVEALTSEKIRKNVRERPIAEFFVPYQMLDRAIRSATDDVIY